MPATHELTPICHEKVGGLRDCLSELTHGNAIEEVVEQPDCIVKMLPRLRPGRTRGQIAKIDCVTRVKVPAPGTGRHTVDVSTHGVTEAGRKKQNDDAST
ncbi:unnamed protein product [Prorocentrum cordatum]|uniref:Uncharacterized protein n=1 Tax=Prorocentrum cordatum TaxID=2364126 RepID=A0ABN9XN66_9DINO|nr:unnamed protein product [Polarella glacialis]